MAREDTSNVAGAVNPPPTSNDYTARGVFNNVNTASGQTGGDSSTSETDLTPSTSTGGGTSANDTTITLEAGAGIDGGGTFTTNQAMEETISFSLPPVGHAGTHGTASNMVQSITVDLQGRVTAITLAESPPTPFNDNLRVGSDAPPSQSVSEEARTEMVTLQVADGYTIENVMSDAGGILESGDIGDPTGLGTNMVTIPVTIPATENTADPVGSGSVTTTTTTRETTTGREFQETRTPLETMTFLPYYTAIFNNSNRQTTADIQLSSFTASDAAITHGGRLLISNPFGAGRPDKYAYFALQANDGEGGTGSARNYMFSFGSFGVDIGVFATREMFGRTFNIYEFPTRGDVDLTVTF